VRSGSPSFVSRNTRPARGQDILTLTQLRHYVRLFWTDRRYGISHIKGGKTAFLRFVGEEHKHHILLKLVKTTPGSEYLSARLQRILSRKVLQVLRGEVIFIENGPITATWRPLLGCPEPPMPDELPPRDHEFRLEKTVLGPRIRRIQSGF
jgi:hypothetical protein